MQNILHRLKFLLTATNQHGVHSPFIYRYVTKCLYVKPNYIRQKSQNILFKSIVYFKAERVWLPSKKEDIKKEIQHEFPSVQFENGPYDILFFSPSEAEKLIRTPAEDYKIHNNTLLLIDDIHRNKANLSTWENIQSHEKVTITIDLFYCGAVFFRKEQAKEHFKIRI